MATARLARRRELSRRRQGWVKASGMADGVVRRPRAPRPTQSDFPIAPTDSVGEGGSKAVPAPQRSTAFAHTTALLEVRSNDVPRLLAWDDGNDFEGCAATSPLQDPLLQEPHVVATHELEATAKVGLHPAVNVF